MITRIYADNFRCLSNFEFRPQQLNLLLGENGSGKTSLFEVLKLVKDLAVGGVAAVSLFAFKKTIWDSRDVQTFELEFTGGDGSFSYRLEIQHPPPEAPQEPYVKDERVELDGKPLFRYTGGEVHLFEEDHSPGAIFPFGPSRSFLPNLESRNPKLQAFKRFVAGINVFQLNPFAVDLFSRQDEPFLTINGSNFASWLRYLNDERPKAKIECEKRLAEIFPDFQRFFFHAAGDRKALLADFEIDGVPYSLHLNQLSEGQRILSILYSVLYGLTGTASVLCFDEPENFISPQEVQPWLQSLRDLVEESSGQALVISHNPEVIDYLAADSAFLFDRSNGAHARVSEWEPEQDLEELMKPSEILIRRG